jgi:hypothetical protein
VWGAEPLAAGTVNVFQKIFFRRLSLLNESTGAVLFDETTAAPALFPLVPALEFETESDECGPSTAASNRSVKLDEIAVANALEMILTSQDLLKELTVGRANRR